MKIHKEEIKSIICKEINAPISLSMDQDLRELGCDSIMFVQVIVALENKYDCEFPDSAIIFSEMNTINKIYKILCAITEK